MNVYLAEYYAFYRLHVIGIFQDIEIAKLRSLEFLQGKEEIEDNDIGITQSLEWNEPFNGLHLYGKTDNIHLYAMWDNGGSDAIIISEWQVD